MQCMSHCENKGFASKYSPAWKTLRHLQERREQCTNCSGTFCRELPKGLRFVTPAIPRREKQTVYSDSFAYCPSNIQWHHSELCLAFLSSQWKYSKKCVPWFQVSLLILCRDFLSETCLKRACHFPNFSAHTWHIFAVLIIAKNNRNRRL